MEIGQFEQKYAIHDACVRHYKAEITKAKIGVRFPIAHEVIFELIERMDELYVSMLLTAPKGLLSGTMVLYRSLIDHWIKIQYLIDKTTTEGNDATAEQYQKHYFIADFLGEQGGAMEMEQLVDGQPKMDIPTYLAKKFPELAGFDKDNQKELSAATVQFKLNTMVRHLTDSYKNLPNLRDGGRIIAMTLPEYSQVSSFGHGGPYAGQLRRSLRESGQTEERLRNQLHIGLTMLGSCKENAFLVYEVDSSFQTILKEMQGLRDLSA